MYRAALPRAGGRRTRWSAAVLVVATTVAATGVLPNQVSAHPAEPADATAGGLPVVLVHGLNSNARVWQDYTGERGFLASIGRRGFAVGDGQAPGVLDMGDWTTPTARTNTIAENAAILAAYIDGVRALTGAEYVDLVAHSMGGLVARYYIDHLMGERDVARLVMLGTPNEGSDCANLPAALGIGIPATLELRPSYLSQVFNRTVTDRNGVPFYVLAGTNVTDPVRSPCASVPSDGVVSQASATTVDGLAAELPVGHTALTGSREAFDAFVAPVLTAAFDPAVYAVTPSPPTEEAVEQFAAVASAHVPRGGRAEFVVHLDAVAVAAFALFDPSRSVQIEVRGASGNIIELDPAVHGVTIVDDPDALVHLGYGFANPRPGPWRVTLLATEATPPAGAGVALAVRTTGGAQLEAATSTLLGRVGAPVEISAQLSADGFAERARFRARPHDLAEPAVRDADEAEQVPVPIAERRVEQLGRRRVGKFVGRFSRQEIAQQVRNHQKPFGFRQQRGIRLFHRRQLVNRVEGEKLDARPAKQFRSGHDRKQLFHHAFRMAIAVMVRIAQKFPVGAEEPEIDRPGIDAEALRLNAAMFGLEQPLFHFMVQTQNIPIQPPAHRHGIVGKPVDFLRDDAPPVQSSEQRAAAACAEIIRQNGGHVASPAFILHHLRH